MPIPVKIIGQAYIEI